MIKILHVSSFSITGGFLSIIYFAPTFLLYIYVVATSSLEIGILSPGGDPAFFLFLLAFPLSLLTDSSMVLGGIPVIEKNILYFLFIVTNTLILYFAGWDATILVRKLFGA